MRSKFAVFAGAPIVALCALASSSAALAASPPRPALPQAQGPAPHAVAARAWATTSNVGWPSYNNDLLSSRFTSAALITSSNVSTLHQVCAAALSPAASNLQSGPLVVGSTLYVTTLASTFAIDATTCRQLWVNTYALPAGAGGTNRGVAYANGLLFRGTVDGHVIAINASNGTTVWNKHPIPSTSYAYFDAAPVVSQNVVYIGTAGGDIGEPGYLLALDATSGSTIWSRQTVPTLGSAMAATWQGATRIAGGSMWTSFTLDAATGTLYSPTGNPGPDFYTADRAGSDLPTDSVTFYNAMSGAVLGGFQAVAGDFHDWDVAATPTLVRASGSDPTLLISGKDGYVRAVDAVTRRQVWQTAVTTIYNAAAPLSIAGTRFCPGTHAGVLWNGAAYSPITRNAYVNSTDWCTTIDLASAPPPFVPDKPWLGSTNSFGTQDSTRSGYVTAIAEQTGAVAWRFHAPTPMVAGITATSAGLIFTADLNGTIYALDATSGRVLKTVATGRPVGGGVITYIANGKQYVAATAGMTSGTWRTSGTASIVVLSP